MNANSRTKLLLRHLTCAAMCLALCLYLPFLTGQIPQIGRALSPMHIPVLLAGFLCGPWWAMVVGLVAPMLRHSLFLMPPLVTAIAMSFELAAYGLFSGLLYQLLPKKRSNIYVSLILAYRLGHCHDDHQRRHRLRVRLGGLHRRSLYQRSSRYHRAHYLDSCVGDEPAKSRLFENGALRRLISAEKRATSAPPHLKKRPMRG